MDAVKRAARKWVELIKARGVGTGVSEASLADFEEQLSQLLQEYELPAGIWGDDLAELANEFGVDIRGLSSAFMMLRPTGPDVYGQEWLGRISS